MPGKEGSSSDGGVCWYQSARKLTPSQRGEERDGKSSSHGCKGLGIDRWACQTVAGGRAGSLNRSKCRSLRDNQAHPRGPPQKPPNNPPRAWATAAAPAQAEYGSTCLGDPTQVRGRCFDVSGQRFEKWSYRNGGMMSWDWTPTPPSCLQVVGRCSLSYKKVHSLDFGAQLGPGKLNGGASSGMWFGKRMRPLVLHSRAEGPAIRGRIT